MKKLRLLNFMYDTEKQRYKNVTKFENKRMIKIQRRCRKEPHQ